MTVNRRRVILTEDGTLQAERSAPVIISETDPSLTEPGLWIELRGDGTIKTFWVENGL